MTFMEMIQGLDEKHRARRPVVNWYDWFIISDDEGMIYGFDGKRYMHLSKEDYLATDWILEELK